jgi:ABC-type transport system involved in multi-copper enzyme maturation permease subunit
MLAVVCICVVFALSCAAIGLFLSTLLNRAYAVILLSYATILLMYLFAPMLVAVTLSRSSSQSVLLSWLCLFNPVMDVAFMAIPNGPLTRVPWWPGVIVQLLLAALLLVASALMVRRFERQRGEKPVFQPLPPAPIDADSPTDADSSLVPPRPVHPDTSQPVMGDNPVLWREIRRPLLIGRWRALAVIAVIGLLVASYLCFASARILDDRDSQMPYACIFTGLYWLLIAVLSATAIAQEKESDTWTTLLDAPLSARDIVLGKLFGTARRMLWPTLLVIAHFSIFATARVISWAAAAVVIWVLVTFNALWASVGLYLSLRFAKVTTAVIVNLLIPVALFIAVPLAMQVAGQALVGRGADWGEVPAIYLPYMYQVQAIDRLRPDHSYSTNLWLPLFGNNVSVEQFLLVAFVMGMAHLALGAAVVGHTIYHFDAIVGRAMQVRRGLTGPAPSVR